MTALQRAARAMVTTVAALTTALVFHTPASAAVSDVTNPATSGVASGQGFAAGGAYKWWTYGDWKVGDCHQTGGHLRLYEDGKLTFSARTWTDFTMSGDVWHARFQLKNAAGNIMFTTATYDSPTMWASKKHDWERQGTFEPGVYNATVTPTQWASC
ncbi:DUF6294 family protein [Streptomyces sp. NPDC048442]|uniref:DUF6294 family protein n=1 Tax=Streptomyces sp. NPDC048442 TaxID=3154823 RepID=UPI00343EDDD2